MSSALTEGGSETKDVISRAEKVGWSRAAVQTMGVGEVRDTMEENGGEREEVPAVPVNLT